MKTLVVISDTHGNVRELSRLSSIFSENDYLIFCGDGITDALRYKDFPKTEFVAVYGNCDGGSNEKVIQVEDVKILITHGHLYGVKYSLDKLYFRAKELCVDLVLYGHSHRKDITTYNGIEFVNPGTMSRYSANQSYAYVVVNGKKVTSTIVDIFY